MFKKRSTSSIDVKRNLDTTLSSLGAKQMSERIYNVKRTVTIEAEGEPRQPVMAPLRDSGLAWPMAMGGLALIASIVAMVLASLG
jgi:hypothetical protein